MAKKSLSKKSKTIRYPATKIAELNKKQAKVLADFLGKELEKMGVKRKGNVYIFP